mmetsp:Transcript_13015/g.21074  ORF Transcript_13015/g.21074 Transcript_13015/m.21074 type:complete len:266 (+) Transcript_13015:157-954(+)
MGIDRIGFTLLGSLGCVAAYGCFMLHLERNKQLFYLDKVAKRTTVEEAVRDDDPEKLVLIKGVVESQGETLVAPKSQVGCVYYNLTKKRITEDMVKTKERKSKKSSRKGETKTSETTYPSFITSESVVEEHSDQANWAVVSLEGHVESVLPVEGNVKLASQPFVELEESFNQFEEPKGGGNKRTVGYRYTEKILRSGTPVFVIGCIHQTTNGPVLCEPAQGPFIISTYTPSELTSKLKAQKRGWLFVSIILASVGTASLVGGLIG